MSLAYKVEELLALRDSVSESAVSIDRFADEDVIKGRSLRLNIAQPAVPAAQQKKPSPTPSIKRGKAEKLLKEHGSPPGIRVTAGGRIVPSDLPSLGTSRYPDNIFKPSGLRVMPGNIMSAQLPSNNSPAARIEIVGGQPVICIGDRMFALPAVNTSSIPGQGASSNMEAVSKHLHEPAALSTNDGIPGAAYGPPRTNSTSPLAGLDLPTLKAQQSLKKQELRTVEQTEVLQGSQQSDSWRANMIEKKRGLIVELDALRKSIAALENENSAAQPNSSSTVPAGTLPVSAPLPTFVPQMQQPIPPAMYPFPGANACPSMMMYPPPYNTYSSYPPPEPTPFMAPPLNPPHSPGSASRRSHAIAIKPPQEAATKTSLNPKSPTYEPSAKLNAFQSAMPPTPSPPKKSSWRTREEPQSAEVQQPLSQKPSFSSIDTTDFFPTNTHEHSSTRLAPRPFEPKQTPNGKAAVPSTPEKYWPASPWNEGGSGRSKKNEATSKLTSWPEAFGKQQSSSSLRQTAAGNPSVKVLGKAPVMASFASNATSSNNTGTRADPDQRTSVDENLPFSRRAVAHLPSTYQEGYQAGYDHIGMPDNPDVLQGYVQGLLHFLEDESKQGRLSTLARATFAHEIEPRTPSLRGLVAGSLPHDSAVSMTFNRNTAQSAAFENVRATKDSLPASLYRDATYSSQGSVKDAHSSYAFLSEAAYVPRQRHVSTMQHPVSASLFSDGLANGGQGAYMAGENEAAKPSQDKGSVGRADVSHINGSIGRQFTGTQIQNRGYGTPLSSQRFYPTPKEMSPNGTGGEGVAGMRPFADHRLSGLDGAMDDLAGIVMETSLEGRPIATSSRSMEAHGVVVDDEGEEATASCFRPSSGKGKQKTAASPRSVPSNGQDKGVASPNAPSSPKKSGEHSPAKAKLEQVTNKFRRNKKDDPRTMSPEDKAKRSDKWRKRFQAIKKEEMGEIEEHRRNNRN
ncbi:hypothetical protein ACEQ8H_005349 [Pleosporales sp. CAS-2024a]